MKSLVAALSLFGIGSAAQAETSHFQWKGVLRYDPNRVIARNGGTLGALMQEFWGAAAAGAVEVSGAFTFQPSAFPSQANANVAGYRNAVTAATVQFGAMALELQPALVEANVASSRVGMITNPDGGFCVDHEHCSAFGVRYPPSGNMGVVLNDAGHMLIDETGVTGKQGDAVGFMVGRTAALGEFSPPVQTSGFGVIGLDGIEFGLFSVEGGQLVPTVGLPHFRDLIGTTQIGRTELWLFIEGSDLIETVRIEGTIDGLQIDP